VVVADIVRPLALKYLWTFAGTPYQWGGDDFSGIDCSGLVVEMLASVGLLKHGQDLTAHGLMTKFHDKEVDECEADPGCLVFWLRRTDHKATHVEVVVQSTNDQIFTLGASGGNSDVRTEEEANDRAAFVKVRPVTYRRGQKVFIDPFREGPE
jgi:hypothetical protein